MAVSGLRRDSHRHTPVDFPVTSSTTRSLLPSDARTRPGVWLGDRVRLRVHLSDQLEGAGESDAGSKQAGKQRSAVAWDYLGNLL